MNCKYANVDYVGWNVHIYSSLCVDVQVHLFFYHAGLSSYIIMCIYII